MDDTWRNGVLIEKVGDTTISRFKIPQDWTPPPLKSGDKKFECIDNPGKWPRFCYFPEFKKNDYIDNQLPTGEMPVLENFHGQQVLK